MFSGGNDGARRDAGDPADHAGAQGDSTPRAIADPTLSELIAAQEEVTRRIAAYDTAHLGTDDRLALLVRDERVTRARHGQALMWLGQLVQQRAFDAKGARNADALSLVLNIDRAAASRRLSAAAHLGDRTTLLGDRMEPELPDTAAALRAGNIDPAHTKVIRKFVASLPNAVDSGTRADAERHLAAAAHTVRPGELAMLSERIAAHIVDEGGFDTPADRVRKRGIFPGKVGPDGMQSGHFVLDAETVAYAEAFGAKFAQRGMNNPDDTAAPVVDGVEPDAATRKRDHRTRPQRLHDAFKMVLRQTLSSGKLGQHRGLPVKVVVTTTLAELRRCAGFATTASGTTVPIPDLIRMGAHADHYLAIFDDDDGRILHLGRTRRLASEDQRLVLLASDRGCTAPGCDRPAIESQVHHIEEWQDGGSTDIESLTYVCDIHHPMIHDGPLGWSTSTAPPGHRYAGRTLWHPPAIVDPQRRGRINHYHHPGDFLWDDDEPAA